MQYIVLFILFVRYYDVNTSKVHLLLASQAFNRVYQRCFNELETNCS